MTWWGIILGPKGLQGIAFTWGLGLVTNSEAEVLAEFQGFRLLSIRTNVEVSIIGDSSFIIHVLQRSKVPTTPTGKDYTENQGK
jgi:ribonuclease HI